jgi:asparagine synthase (glutamine-hydrolysing)
MGIVSDEGGVQPATIDAMAACLRHRGPDDSGMWISPDGRVGLGHTRLSIIDLTQAGRQPMTNESDDIRLVFNGEIYNFRELRTELESLGHRFRSRTDAEVVVHGYEQWGDGVVVRLRGMFAFAIWDDPRRRLLLARDRLGIKPLYYAANQHSFSFASELKAIEPAIEGDRAVDASALWDYLTYGYVPAPKSVYRSVRKLPAGHTLVYENGLQRINAYWDVNFAPTSPRDEAEVIEDLRSLLSDAVSSHLVSDVPLGSLLSAGIDSSVITALAARERGSMRTYTVGFGDAAWSEAEPARRTASYLKTVHHEIDCDAAQARSAAARMGHWFDEPFADTSAVPTSVVCRAARRDVTVALSGDGGDELFGGYRHYAKFLDLRRRNLLPSALRRPLGNSLSRAFAPTSKAKRSLARWAMDDLALYVSVHGGITRKEKEALLPADVVERFAHYDDYWNFRRYWREDLDVWSRMQYIDLKTYLPDDLLVKVDRVSMDVSLEVRPPLLDHHLVEFVAAIPHGTRTPHGAPKHLFKKAVENLIPQELLTREKQGFSPPTEEWLRDGVFGHSPNAKTLQPRDALLWRLLEQWTSERLGVNDPTDVLREGP